MNKYLPKTEYEISTLIIGCKVSISEKACLNSTGLGEKCFSIHFDLEFWYNDAEKHCQQNHSGTVWSMSNEEEVIYLKKLHARNK